MDSDQAILQQAFDPLLASIGAGEIIVFGGGRLGSFLIDLCRERNLNPVKVLDDFLESKEIKQVPVCRTENAALADEKRPILLGTLTAGQRMSERLASLGFEGRILGLSDSFRHVRPKSSTEVVSPRFVIEAFRDVCKDRRAFVLGNGPSLLTTDPRRIQNDITIACNNIFLLEDFTPDYYMVEDPLLAQDRAARINALDWAKFYPSTVSHWLTNGVYLDATVGEWPKDGFSTDLCNGIEVGYTVTYAMLQLAYHLGCNPVYLLGVDHTYRLIRGQYKQTENVFTSVEDDPNHFHLDYFGKGYRWHDPKVDRMEAAYQVARSVYRDNGREIFNATAGGNLDLFPRVDFESLIG